MPFPPLASPVDKLSDADVRRQVHQLIHPDLGAVGQRRLSNGRVLVIGADEVGAPALALLADSGVGVLGILDGAPLRAWDRYPGRPALDDEPAGERSRAATWTDALGVTHPTVTVVAHETRLDPANAVAIVSAYDVVVCVSEDPALCYLVDDACAHLRKPYVWGSLNRVQGQVGVFWEPHGPTFRDVYPTPPVPYFRGVQGVLKVLSAWIAATVATETVKLLTGGGEPLVGRVMEYDAMRAVCRVVPVPRNHEATRPAELTAYEPYCGLLSPEAAEAARESTISVTELKHLLDSETPLCLVDVREPDEHALVNLPGSLLIPKDEFLDGDAAARLPQDRKIVLFCRMGIRSAEALAVVKAHGHPDAVHLGGGIIAWAQQIDPSLPVY